MFMFSNVLLYYTINNDFMKQKWNAGNEIETACARKLILSILKPFSYIAS